MATKKKVRGFKQSELVLPESDVLPFHDEPLEPSRSTIMTPRTTTVRNLHAYARDEWAPKPLRGWLAIRQAAGWFGIGRTWVPYWCAFDSRYLLLYVKKPGTEESHTATGYSVTSLDPAQARTTITVAPEGITKTEIPLPAMMIDLARSTVEAKFEDGQLYAFIHRPNYPDYVLCGNHIKYWIIEWQKINTTWTDESGAMVDVPTDVVDKSGNVMEPRMDMSERFFLRQQGAFLLYMAGPLQFEAWHSRLGDKWFLHFVTFDAYDPVPKIHIFGDGKDPNDQEEPKVVDLSTAVISEYLDKRQRAKMKIEIPGRPAIVCDGPNIQWWLGALQWATRDKGKNKSMFRDLIKHRRFVPVEKSISILRMQRRATEVNIKRKGEIKRATLLDASSPDSDKDLNGASLSSATSFNGSADDSKIKAGKGDWKAKSGNHATSKLSEGPRLSAAEFARQAGQSPPRRQARRSSAPKPDQASILRAEKRISGKFSDGSRAQIPLISLGMDDANGASKDPNPNAVELTSLSPRRKSERKLSKSKSPRIESPLAESSAPNATSLSPRKKSVLADDVPNDDIPALLPVANKGKRKSSKKPELIITEDDIATSPRSPRSPRSPKNQSAMNDPNEGTTKPKRKSPRDKESSDIPDQILTSGSLRSTVPIAVDESE